MDSGAVGEEEAEEEAEEGAEEGDSRAERCQLLLLEGCIVRREGVEEKDRMMDVVLRACVARNMSQTGHFLPGSIYLSPTHPFLLFYLRDLTAKSSSEHLVVLVKQ